MFAGQRSHELTTDDADEIGTRMLADQNFARSGLECGDLAPLSQKSQMDTNVLCLKGT
jgi:hypothetical protein